MFCVFLAVNNRVSLYSQYPFVFSFPLIIYILRRLLQSLLALLVVSLLVFVGVFAVGNPVDILISPEATELDRLQTMKALGLDKPLWQQYGYFMKQALGGDLGYSFAHNVPALGLIFERLPATLELAITSLLIAILVGLPLGLYAGLYPKTWGSKFIMTGSIFGFSLPTFWTGLMLIMIFAISLGWLPASGRGETSIILPFLWGGIRLSVFSWEGIRHLLLPGLTLSLLNMSLIIRLTRSGVQETLLSDYIQFARAKGLSNLRIVGIHVLKNILLPIITVVALQFGSVIAFAVVTESIFAWPGVGKLLIDSINVLDRPVIVAYLLMVVGLFIIINLVVDILYSLLDPRVRLVEIS